MHVYVAMCTAAGPLLVVKDSSPTLMGCNKLKLKNVCFAAECIEPMHATKSYFLKIAYSNTV